MTTRLEQAFAEASKLLPTEQDVVADWLLAELESERRWDKLFADSQDMLSKLAADVLAEHRNGKTQNLDPDQICFLAAVSTFSIADASSLTKEKLNGSYKLWRNKDE